MLQRLLPATATEKHPALLHSFGGALGISLPSTIRHTRRRFLGTVLPRTQYQHLTLYVPHPIVQALHRSGQLRDALTDTSTDIRQHAHE